MGEDSGTFGGDGETARCVANVLIAAEIGYYSMGICHSRTIRRFVKSAKMPAKAVEVLMAVARLDRRGAARLARGAVG